MPRPQFHLRSLFAMIVLAIAAGTLIVRLTYGTLLFEFIVVGLIVAIQMASRWPFDRIRRLR